MLSLNKVKIFIGSMIRRINVLYYKSLGVNIGKNVFISYGAKIDTTYRNCIFIADNCYITYSSSISAHDHSVYRRKPFHEDDGRGIVKLEKNVFVGNGARILRNVSIGENSIIAAGAIVTKDVPPNVIVGGNPARIIKHFVPIKK